MSINIFSPSLLGDPYSKPRLSALDSHVVNAGGNVTLQCISWQRYDGFILIKEGEPKFSRTLDSQYIFTGHLQAMFSLGPMTSRNTGTFRCYGFYKRDPQKLSMPSDPLEVHRSGESTPSMNHLSRLQTICQESCCQGNGLLSSVSGSQVRLPEC